MRGRRKDKKKGKGDAEGGLFEGHADPRRITPVDIQKKEFRLAMRGYHERDVDEFLDEVTEEVARLYAENKRLQEDLESRGTARTGGPSAAGAAEAQAIVRQAHDEADRILREAEARARALAANPTAGTTVAGPGPAVAGAALAGFLSREKSFLQNLAKMMQDHANAMKEDVRRVRQAATQQPAPATSPPSESGGSRAGETGELASSGRPEEPPLDRPHEAWRPSEGPAASEPPPGSPPTGSPYPAEPPYQPEPSYEPEAPNEAEPPYQAESAFEPPSPSEEPEQPPYFMDDRSPTADPGFPAPVDLPPVAGPSESDPRWDDHQWDEQGFEDPHGQGQADAGQPSEPYIGEPTRQWTFGGEGGSGGEDFDDVTRPPQEREPEAEKPADPARAVAEIPSARWAPQPDEEKPEDERSIRELFWGED